MRENKMAALGWFHALKENAKCVQCGEGHPSYIEFHHVNPATKCDTLSNMVHNGLDIATLEAERAKTVPLCANHHRLAHWDERRKRLAQYGTQMTLEFVNA